MPMHLMKNSIQTKRIAVIAALLVVGALIAFVLLPMLYQKESATVTVIAPRAPIAAGTQVTEEMLVPTTIGSYGISSSVIKDMSEVVGKFALVDISKDDLLLPEKFSNVLKESNPVDLMVQEGQVLVSLPFNSSAAAVCGYVQAGDIVNVAIYNEDFGRVSEDGSTDSGCVIMPADLQGLIVYSVVNSSLKNLSDASGKIELTGSDRVPAAITLVVSNAQAKKLVEYSYSSTIHFIRT